MEDQIQNLASELAMALSEALNSLTTD